MRAGYVDLDRRFLDFTDEESGEDASLRSYLNEYTGKGIDWGKLLQSRYVVVLGEAGSGKTWEMQARAEKLRREGATSFFVRLERLANRSLIDALDPIDIASLEQWKSSDGTKVVGRRYLPDVEITDTAPWEATFFLDAVDEAKLLRPRAFEDALTSLVRGLDQDLLGRLRCVLSCRVSEWRGNADREMLLDRFKISRSPAKKSADELPDLRIVQLAPLDLNRVARLADCIGITSTAPFLESIENTGAEAFVRRPKDVLNLTSYWNSQGRLGTLTELIEFDIAAKLRESEERDRMDPLSAAQAREGAQTLAAAVVLCRRFSFVIPDELADPLLAVDAIDPAHALAPNWTSKQMRALLGRPIFDEATYGRVRFHHRTTAEFLAAGWLRTRVDEGCPVHVVEDLLFCTVHGREVVPLSAAPIAAWLAIGTDPLNLRIARRLLRFAPELLLKHGDPQSLPFEVRNQLLRGTIEKFKNRRRFRLGIDADQLKRIAHVDLTPELNRWIADQSISEDARELVIRIAWHGRLSDCMPSALKVIRDKSEPESLREYAILAVRDCGDAEALRTLAEIASVNGRIQPRAGELLCEALFPQVIEVEALISIIRRIRRRKGRRLRGMSDVIVAAIDRAPERQLAELLDALVKLARRPPFAKIGNKSTSVSRRYLWLGSPLVALIKRILQASHLDPALVAPIARALHLIGELLMLDERPREKEQELQSATERHPEVRRAYIWSEFQRLKTTHNERPSVYQVFGYYEGLSLSSADREWIVRDLSDRDQEQREFALQLASACWQAHLFDSKFKATVWRSIRNDMGMRARFRQEFPGYWTRSHSNLRRSLYQFIHWKARARWFAFGRRWSRWKDWWYLRAHMRRLRDGGLFSALHYLAWFRTDVSADEDGNDRAEVIRKAFGASIASAAREGCKRFWRKFKPPLPHETGDAPNGVHVGLLGIAWDLEDGWALERATIDEAETMARYAVHNLNSFPKWFETVTKAHPDTVSKVLRRSIDAEWQAESTLPHVIEVLSKLRHASSNECRLVDRIVWEKLIAGDPPHRAVLAQALEVILLAGTFDRVSVAQLAAAKARTYRFGHSHFLIWLTLWLSAEGSTAADFLVRYVETIPTEADSLFELLGSTLGERNRYDFPLFDSPSYLELPTLARLIPLFFRYVRRADDIERAELVTYSPTARDHAQDFRDRLLQILAERSESEVYQALVSLKGHPDLVETSDYIAHLIDRRLARDAEVIAWGPSDIAAFAQEHEITPRSGLALFRIVLKRLDDIRASVESDDYSRRAELKPNAHEVELQKWLARNLREMRRGRYAEVREAEVDDGKTPDIRIVAPNLQPTSIEVKWAHKYSYNQLMDALENQIVGQYLRAADSRHGVMLIACADRYRRWDNGTAKVDFADLIAALRAKARDIAEKNDLIEGLEVVSIDASEP